MAKHRYLTDFERMLKIAVCIIILSLTLFTFIVKNGEQPSEKIPPKLHHQSNTSSDFASLMLRMPSKRTSKWIVITSIQSPTEDVKRLAAYSEWTLVVVADKKTPEDWNLTDVHFLSLDIQSAMGFESVNRLPTNSYTRKNAGYLYAIANGAEWIYDTDDDNKPYGKGLDQFEYFSETTRGLRFTSTSSIQESLFNPYRHFGRPDMWPRGFPLELLKNHDHLDGSYRLCREQRPPVVQQGIVHKDYLTLTKDPDVDAIYRLLHAERETGLNESFNQFAPPVILAPGTYAPWNSQNTLFSRAAFFGLFLPTTVAFRVTDIWRSYFTQALLHAAGETIAFVPVNAIQIRNAHNYLKDFNDESDVYSKSGEIVRFIDEWRCEGYTIDKCTIELANHFASRGFWRSEDAKLVSLWVKDLKKIGFKFPPLRLGSRNDNPVGEDNDPRRNCRRAHTTFENDFKEQAASNIDNFAEIKNWCDVSHSYASSRWFFPAPERLESYFHRSTAMKNNRQIVAIITSNWPWKIGMGLLQRMYEAQFAMLIFCGHYPKQDKHAFKQQYPEGMDKNDAYFPNLKRPINYIDLSDVEVQKGFVMYYCLAKVEEMKIQNVKGYVMFSDDTVFNYWNPFNLDVVQGGHWEPRDMTMWNHTRVGMSAMRRTVTLLKQKYSNDSDVRDFVSNLRKEIAIRPKFDENEEPVTDPYEYLMLTDGKTVADWLYVPSSNISFVATFAQIAHEGELYLELFFSKVMQILPSEGGNSSEPVRLWFMWGEEERRIWTQLYDPSLLAIHPIKLSHFKELKARRVLCNSILDYFYQKCFNLRRTI